LANLCEKLGAKLVVCPIKKAGEILMDELKKLISKEQN
jgi:selenocysteine lyase/cysteine desulfurase